jgi:hypothetical protein
MPTSFAVRATPTSSRISILSQRARFTNASIRDQKSRNIAVVGLTAAA